MIWDSLRISNKSPPAKQVSLFFRKPVKSGLGEMADMSRVLGAKSQKRGEEEKSLIGS
jgi:hypothetical protein